MAGTLVPKIASALSWEEGLGQRHSAAQPQYRSNRGEEARMPEGYVPRYQTTGADGASALIVADQQGNAYLFAAGALQVSTTDDATGERLLGLLGPPERWQPLPDARVYSLDTLRAIGRAAQAGDRFDCDSLRVR
jgi:hypothetical protein